MNKLPFLLFLEGRTGPETAYKREAVASFVATMRSPADSMQVVALKLSLGQSQSSFPLFQGPLSFLVRADLVSWKRTRRSIRASKGWGWRCSRAELGLRIRRLRRARPQHGVLFGMTGAGKPVIVADLFAQIGHRFGFRLIVEEGLSRAVLT